MTQEQIKRSASKYAIAYHSSGKYGILITAETAFLAGAESRQAEIDELDKELNIVHSCLTALFERQYSNEGERTYRIQYCLSEIEKLKK